MHTGQPTPVFLFCVGALISAHLPRGNPASSLPSEWGFAAPRGRPGSRQAPPPPVAACPAGRPSPQGTRWTLNDGTRWGGGRENCPSPMRGQVKTRDLRGAQSVPAASAPSSNAGAARARRVPRGAGPRSDRRCQAGTTPRAGRARGSASDSGVSPAAAAPHPLPECPPWCRVARGRAVPAEGGADEGGVAEHGRAQEGAEAEGGPAGGQRRGAGGRRRQAGEGGGRGGGGSSGPGGV